MTDVPDIAEVAAESDEAAPAQIAEGLSAPVRSVHGLGLVLVAFLGLNVVGDLVMVWTNIVQLQILEALSAGVYLSDAAAAANDDRVQLLSFLSVGLYFVTAVVFVVWTRRAYGNLVAFDYQPQHGLGWAIGAWFTPILNFIRPFQIMREIHAVSDPQRTLGEYVEPKATGVMTAWWVLWIGSRVLGQVAEKWRADSVPELIDAVGMWIAFNGTSIVCALLAMSVVHAASTRQTALIQRLNGTAAPATF